MSTERLGDDQSHSGCPFCEIIAGRAPAEIVRHYSECVVFVPLNPVTEGHVLVVSRKHITNIKVDRWALADVMRTAAIYAHPPCNFILSVGAEATQTIRHLHMHVVPRRFDDGLELPWGDNAHLGREHRENAYAFYNGSGIDSQKDAE